MRMPRFCGFVIFPLYIRGAYGDGGNHERLVANFGDNQSRALRQPDRAALLARLSPASFTVAPGVHAGHEHAVWGKQPLRRHSCPLDLRCRPAPSPPTGPWRLKRRMTENGRRARSGPPALRRSIAALQGIRRNSAPMGSTPTGPGEHTPLPCPARTIHATLIIMTFRYSVNIPKMTVALSYLSTRKQGQGLPRHFRGNALPQLQA